MRLPFEVFLQMFLLFEIEFLIVAGRHKFS